MTIALISSAIFWIKNLIFDLNILLGTGIRSTYYVNGWRIDLYDKIKHF